MRLVLYGWSILCRTIRPTLTRPTAIQRLDKSRFLFTKSTVSKRFFVVFVDKADIFSLILLCRIINIEGKVARDFPPSVFFINQLTWGPDSRPKAVWHMASYSPRKSIIFEFQLCHSWNDFRGVNDTAETDFGDFRRDYLGEYDAICKTV
jgi:hypothetical protein